jgi:hypothetical protein
MDKSGYAEAGTTMPDSRPASITTARKMLRVFFLLMLDTPSFSCDLDLGLRGVSPDGLPRCARQRLGEADKAIG